MGEKGGMQLNKAEIIAFVIYIQLWAQRLVFYGFWIHSFHSSRGVCL